LNTKHLATLLMTSTPICQNANNPVQRICDAGANPSTSEFTTKCNASVVVVWSVRENIFFKAHRASRGIVNFYSSGVVAHKLVGLGP
jgi:hypothetical protein